MTKDEKEMWNILKRKPLDQATIDNIYFTYRRLAPTLMRNYMDEMYEGVVKTEKILVDLGLIE